jgi:DNA-binding SARP family transcriptional activator
MTVLYVFLLGKFCARQDDQAIGGLELRKVQELFCYLICHRAQPSSREKLASLLWENTATTQSRANFRRTLWQLQTTLNEHQDAEKHDQPALLVAPEWIQINPQAQLWVDVEVFEETFAHVRGQPGEQMDYQGAQRVAEATQLYRGDFLDGVYLDWCLYERERLQQIYLVLLNKLTAYCEATRQYERGLDYAAAVLRHDRAHEQTHRQMMRLYALQGDRTAALRQYERCALALDEELGVRPVELTCTLYEHIKQSDPASNLATSLALDMHAPHRAEPDSDPELPGVLNQLKQLQLALHEIQHQVHQNIQVVERILRNRS